MYGVISKLSLWLLAAYDPTARRGRERQVHSFSASQQRRNGEQEIQGSRVSPTMKVSRGYFYLARRRTELSQRGMAVAGAA